MTADVLRHLEETHEKMCTNPMAPQDYSALNREFHIAIYQLFGWTFLYQIIINLIEKVHFFRTYYPVRSRDFDAFNRDHEEMLKSLKEKDERGCLNWL
jgi:DNA-binding GntR family transcriptional regulator